MAEGRVDPVARNVLAEEHDVGLEHPAARRHGGMTKDEKSAPSRSASPSGASVASSSSQSGLSRPSSSCKLLARRSPPAIHAAHEIDASVQVDHPRAARRLVQPIHVLGQQKLASAPRLEPGQRAMRVVGLSPTNEPPADEAARPIAAARLFLAHEGLIGHGLGAFPLALGVAIVRDPEGVLQPAPVRMNRRSCRSTKSSGWHSRSSADLVEPQVHRGLKA